MPKAEMYIGHSGKESSDQPPVSFDNQNTEQEAKEIFKQKIENFWNGLNNLNQFLNTNNEYTDLPDDINNELRLKGQGQNGAHIKEALAGILNRQEFISSNALIDHYASLGENAKYHLIADWTHLYYEISRAELLLKTYWPENNIELQAVCGKTNKSVKELMDHFDVTPHQFELMERCTENMDNDRFAISNYPLSGAFLNSPEVAEKMLKKYQIDRDSGTEYVRIVDVNFWGYDYLDENGNPEISKTKLITASYGDGSQSKFEQTLGK